MKKLEHPPNWREDKFLSEGVKLSIHTDFKSLIEKINDKYLYWDKVKYQDTPKKIKHQVLWSAVKFSRTIHAQRLRFGDYNFIYNLTNYIQKELHEFDLNIGGQLGTQNIIPRDEQKRYLVSSIMEEAIASSQIEGAVTTRKKAKEMLRKNKKPKNESEQMIVNNYLTIKHIVENKNAHLTKESLLEIHKLITHQTLENSEDEGRYRMNNTINVVDAMSGEVFHTPPDFNKIPELMEELFSFFNDDKHSHFIHPIIKGCIIHFMLGYIHPFIDGNGRTARALFYWYLLKKGYWLIEYLSISRLIIKNKTQYAYAFLYSETDENDLTYFIHYKLKTMKLAFEDLQRYIQRKINEKRQYIQFQKIKGINERQARILKWFYEDPDIYFTIKELENRLGVSNQTGRNDILGLLENGYVELIELDKKTKAFCKSKKFDKLIEKRLSKYRI